MCGLPAWLQQRAGVEVANVQHRVARAAWCGLRAREIDHGVIGKHLGHAQEMQHLEQPGLQIAMDIVTFVGKVVGELAAVALQRVDECTGQLVKNLVVLRL